MLVSRANRDEPADAHLWTVIKVAMPLFSSAGLHCTASTGCSIGVACPRSGYQARWHGRWRLDSDRGGGIWRTGFFLPGERLLPGNSWPGRFATSAIHVSRPRNSDVGLLYEPSFSTVLFAAALLSLFARCIVGNSGLEKRFGEATVSTNPAIDECHVRSEIAATARGEVDSWTSNVLE